MTSTADTGPTLPTGDTAATTVEAWACADLESCWVHSALTIRLNWEGTLSGHDIGVLEGTPNRLVASAPHHPAYVGGGWSSSLIAALELDGTPGWSPVFNTQLYVDAYPQATGANPPIVARMGSSVVLPGDVTGDGIPDVVALSDALAPEVPGMLLFPGPIGPLGGLPLGQDAPGVLSGDADIFDGARCGDLTGDGVAELVLDDGIVVGPIDGSDATPLARDVPLTGRVYAIDDRTSPGCLWGDGSAVHLLTGVSAGSPVTTTLFQTPGWPSAMHALELPGGVLTTAVGLMEGASYRVEVRASPTAPPLVLPLSRPPRAVLQVDLDGDGTLEVLVGTTETLEVYDATGTSQGTWWVSGSVEPPGFRLMAADVQLGPEKELVLSEPWAMNTEGLVFVFPLPLAPLVP